MNHSIKQRFGKTKRVCAFLMCLVMLFGMLPLTIPSADAAPNAASWETPYMNKLLSWNIMRGDQYGNLNPKRAITRAEYVSMMNRAFGYTQVAKQPFKDVHSEDWFADDIAIAAHAGYFKGTSKTTASPLATLTREEAATMLCRNLMLRPEAAEDLAFKDSHLAHSWSRGFIKAAAEKGILKGDPAGTFRPRQHITRGEVASMLVHVIGTPIQSPGTYSSSVSGNLMVSSSDVTLDNLTVTGDLYITAGVGLGRIDLNNVEVLGQIIVCGAGESDKGNPSIILKNTTAREMIVDSPTNQYVTIRAIGATDIDKVSVRTNAFLENRGAGRHGFHAIKLDGEDGLKLDLAGNIHEAITITPKSLVTVGSGTVGKLTVDETAVDSKVVISQGAVVEELNLDTATTVSGKGDIGTLRVNAPGCIVEMLPDIIIIRPGITANIAGIVMDSALAEQMTDSPRILSGYPRLPDIAPKQVETVFRTNKPGTLYWAVRLSGDGPFVADDLIHPPTYGGKIVKSGSLAIKDANEDVAQKINGLNIGNSYVLSAVLVDARGDKSPVKTTYFTTPDDSKPAFAAGYPKPSTISNSFVMFDVAATKTCNMYWAIYKKGLPAPTANDFKDGTLSGAVTSGKRKLIRSEEDNVLMGNRDINASDALKEVTEYDAYFFLTDSINESSVIKVTVKTADRTPPVFRTNYPRISKIQAKALDGEAMINENGKVYWALVRRGTENYPQTNPGLDADAQEFDKKLQIKGGMYALASGSFNAKQDKVANFKINNLEPEAAYDIYFVAEDEAGNLSEITTILNAKTLDSSAPELVELRFSKANDKGVPLANTDVTLVFSEDIYSRQTQLSLAEMYASGKVDFTIAGDKDQTKITWKQVIESMFVFQNMDMPTDQRDQMLQIGDLGRTSISVRINDAGQTELTFYNQALQLRSGTNYRFKLNDVTDSSNNIMPANTYSDTFRILDAQVDFSKLDYTSADIGQLNPIGIEASLSMIPYAKSTGNVAPGTRYDLIIASDTTISFKLYRREYVEGAAWNLVETTSPDNIITITKTPGQKWSGTSVNYAEGIDSADYPALKDLANGYEYAIEFTSINLNDDRNKWDATVNLYFFCAAGSSNALSNLVTGGSISETRWQKDVIEDKKVASIGNPSDFTIDVRRVNQNAPMFLAGYPRVQPGDSITRIDYMLDRKADVYYVVAPTNILSPSPLTPQDIIDIGNFPDHTTAEQKLLGPGKRDPQGITMPTTQNIMHPTSYSPENGYRTGSVKYSGSGQASFTVENLEPNRDYYIYFVLMGSYKDPSPVWCYKFNTKDVVPPMLTANSADGQAAITITPAAGQPSVEAELHWLLYPQATDTGYPPLFSTVIKDGKKAIEMMESEAFNEWKDDSGKFGDYTGSATFKEALWQIMQGGSNASPAPDQNGSKRNFSGTTTVIDKELLQPEPTKYLFIVAAKNELGGMPVFRVVKNIQKVNREGPLVYSMHTSSVFDNGKKFYSGTLTVTFDTELYVFGNDMKAPQKYTPIKSQEGDLFPAPPRLEYTPVSSLNPTRVLGIKYKDFQVGDTLTITPTCQEGGQTVGGYFSNKAGYMRTDGSVTFELRRKLDQDGQEMPEGPNNVEFVLADGTTSETNPKPEAKP